MMSDFYIGSYARFDVPFRFDDTIDELGNRVPISNERTEDAASGNDIDVSEARMHAARTHDDAVAMRIRRMRELSGMDDAPDGIDELSRAM